MVRTTVGTNQLRLLAKNNRKRNSGSRNKVTACFCQIFTSFEISNEKYKCRKSFPWF